tara:strand:- start:445 stop:1767 length:1323 start_codon:yes stop_codon:yes gene_type:complete
MFHYRATRSTIDRFKDGKDVFLRNVMTDQSISLDNQVFPFYGKVNYNFNPVQPNEQFLRPIGTNNGRILSTLDFVADAFTGLQGYMKRASFLNKINRNSVFIDLVPVDAYRSIDVQYRNYLINIFDGFMREYIFKENRKNKIGTLTDFINYFIEYINLVIDEYPLTKSKYYLEIDDSFLGTGLAIKINNLSQARLLNDPGYGYFVKGARKFGFMPVRTQCNTIVANIKSEGSFIQAPTREQPQFDNRVVNVGMLRYYEENDLDSDTIFKDRYFSMIHNRDNFAFSEFNLLKTYMLQFYDRFRIDYPFNTTRKICYNSGNPKTTPYRVYREGFQYPTSGDYPTDFKSKYPDTFWLSLYFNIKLVEMRKSQLDDREYTKRLNKAMSLYHSTGIPKALGYIHTVTKTVPPQFEGATRRRTGGAITSSRSVPTGGSTGGGASGY